MEEVEEVELVVFVEVLLALLEAAAREATAEEQLEAQ